MAGKHRKKNQHPSSEEFAAFLDNKVSVTEHELVLAHLSECADCRKLVAKVISSEKTVRDPQKHRS